MELWCKCVSLYGAALEPLGRRRRRRLGLGVWDEELTEIVVLQVAGCRTDRAGQWQGGVLCSVLCFRFPFAWCVRAWCVRVGRCAVGTESKLNTDGANQREGLFMSRPWFKGWEFETLSYRQFEDGYRCEWNCCLASGSGRRWMNR